ncbi:UbiA family prenyltransferase [Sandaracinobacter sp.]|uniref:UbiA family prenyltransferase n=1 Tax=Sandaracinobacter sp. TaxID=2487581 RepID=UPI0035AEB646
MARLENETKGAVYLARSASLRDQFAQLGAQLRLHQWSKNLLLFAPMVVGHQFTEEALLASTLGFFAFCLASSAGYVVNDLVDVAADRTHPARRNRPLASGRLSVQLAWALIPLLTAGAIAIGVLFLPQSFLVALGAYLLGTISYSLYFKRRLAVDVVVLCLLYTLRVLAGNEAIGADPTEWLVGFSMFLFLALALIKRHSELMALGTGAPNRAYRTEDLRILLPLAGAAALASVTIFARYIGETEVLAVYSKPVVLWFVAPILLYWLLRLLLLANRGDLHEDPVVFATTDPKSLLCGALIAVILLMAW